jgi:hypothetical protein
MQVHPQMGLDDWCQGGVTVLVGLYKHARTRAHTHVRTQLGQSTVFVQ